MCLLYGLVRNNNSALCVSVCVFLLQDEIGIRKLKEGLLRPSFVALGHSSHWSLSGKVLSVKVTPKWEQVLSRAQVSTPRSVFPSALQRLSGKANSSTRLSVPSIREPPCLEQPTSAATEAEGMLGILPLGGFSHFLGLLTFLKTDQKLPGLVEWARVRG